LPRNSLLTLAQYTPQNHFSISKDHSMIANTGHLAVALTFMIGVATATAAEEKTVAKTSMGWPAPMSNEEAWKLLPTATRGEGQPLPSWARMIAKELPKTTAAFLELDYAQRTAGPLEPRLRAAMRWTAARAIRSDYAIQAAKADGTRAGITAAQWASLEDGSRTGWSSRDQAAIDFAHAMTVDSDGYSDELFAQLVQMFDQRQVASMVLHMAYANFQDRFLICLGAPFEAADAEPPLDVKFDPDTFVIKMSTPPAGASGKPKAPPQEPGEPNIIKHEKDYTWLSYPDLQSRLAKQRARQTRLPIPEWSELAGNLPEGLMEKPSDIVWYRIAFGYAHELAVPFEIYMRTAGSEVSKNWDRTFGGSVFWIVTDAMKCPYCMGHCEMNWEVGGLSEKDIAHRSEELAGNDWSMFTAPQQKALAFARKLTSTPGEVNAADMDSLRQGFGDQRALFLALNSSRYNYMTRISNGFQLTLESTNVFWDYYKMPTPTAKPEAPASGK
jgi:alkylhydroperoxidase family enzyme